MSWTSAIGKNLKELRVIFCQSNSRSQGMREFVANNYFPVKEQNPYFPFLVRECEEADPVIVARYRFGVERKVHTANLSQTEIESVVSDLVSQADKINKSL